MTVTTNDRGQQNVWAKEPLMYTQEITVTQNEIAEKLNGRLAMLAAAAWPIQELAHPSLAKLAGAPELLSDGRSPSILNGGLVAGPVPAFLLATAAAIGYLDVQV